MKRVVMGILDTPAHADVTVRKLTSLGFSPRAISVLYPDRHGDHDFAFEASSRVTHGALVGIGFGAILGAMIGLALGIVGLIPSVQLLAREGPMLTALSGASIGALVLGVAGAIIGLRIPAIEAKYYEGKVLVGTILLGVHVTSRAEILRAQAVLDSVAASDVHTTSEAALPISS